MTTDAAALAALYPTMTAQQTQAAPRYEGNSKPESESWLNDLPKPSFTPEEQKAMDQYNKMHDKPPVNWNEPQAKKPYAAAPAEQKPVSPVSVEQATQTLTAAAQELGVDTSTMPEGLATFVKDSNLGADGVKNLLTLHTEAIENQREANVQSWNEAVKQTFSKDEIETAKSAVNQYADAEVKQLLHQSGLGSHPAIVGLFARIGRGR
jgi:hypothetical protein